MKAVDLEPHQRKAVAGLDSGKILCGRVGSGKTRVAFQYYVEKEAPRDVIVITTAKKRDSFDWEDEGNLHGLGKDLSMPGRGTLTVDSWNNLWKYVHVHDAFFVFDEQRLVGSGAWVKVFLKIAKNNRWILLSATPGDTWLDYIPVFVANGFYKNRSEFLREHVVYAPYSKFPKVQRYIAVGRLERHRRSLLVDMPFERHTTRVIENVLVNHDKETFEKVVKKRWHPFESRPLRDVAEQYSVMRKVVNTDASRLEAVRSLTMIHPKLIVFYNFDYELEILRKLGEPCPESTTLQNESTPESTLLDMSYMMRSEPTLKTSTTDEPHRSTPTTSTDPRFATSKDVTDNSKTADTRSEEWTSQKSTLKPKQSVNGEKSLASSSKTSLEESESPSISRTTAIRQSPSLNFPGTRDASQIIIKKCRDSETSDSSMSGNVIVGTRKEPEEHIPNGSSNVGIAEWNGHKHQPIPETDRWVYLVQYMAGAEGWNCVETDACVFYSLTYSYRLFEQCQGRIDRMNTPFTVLKYYVLKSNSMIDSAIFAKLLKKEKFNEKKTWVA